MSEIRQEISFEGLKNVKKAGGSIRDVAQATGFSIATVSRVMNGNVHVTEATRKRVLEACEALDYVPNPAARALTTTRSKTVAAIIPTIEHSVFAKFISAIEGTLGAHGYALVLAVAGSGEEEELAAAKKLLGLGAEAFILSGMAHSAPLLEMLNRRRVPHVFTSVWNAESEVPTIGYDNAGLSTSAVRYLYQMGHHDIAVIHGQLADNDRTRMRKQGIVADPPAEMAFRFFETEISVAGGKRAMNEVIVHYPACTAVLCFSDVLAMGTYFSIAEAGLSVPKDYSVMGFDNIDWASETVPALTTIDLPAAQMGQATAAEIMNALETGEPCQRHLIAADIVERASVRRRG